MTHPGITLSVFTKPWRTPSLAELGAHVQALGFDGIELPVRPGYQIEPERAAELPHAVAELAQYDVRIFSIAGPTDEATIAACAEAGVPIIRVMAPINEGERYLDAEARYRREYDALIPLLDRYGVKVGVQNHTGRYVTNAIGLRRLVEGYDPRHIGIVWDAAHESLEGGLPDLALDAAGSYLCMVNLKNAFRQLSSGPEADAARWSVYWTGGRYGFASWKAVVDELKARHYEGTVCLTAEYSDAGAVNRLIAEDLAYVRTLLK